MHQGVIGSAVDVSGQQTLWDLVAYWSARQPQKECLVYMPDQEAPGSMMTMTWERVASLVFEMRKRLYGVGVADQRVVMLALPSSPLSVVSWLAIASNGAIVQIVDPDSGTLPLVNALRATSPVAVICYRENESTVARALTESGCDSQLIVAGDLSLSSTTLGLSGLVAQADVTPPNARADSIACLLHTSGTSGSPKLVEITHRNFVTAGERLARNEGHTGCDSFYLCSPFFHVNATLYLCMPALIVGGAMAITPRFSATRYFDTARRTGATVASMVAAPLRMALHKVMDREGGVDAGSLRLIQYGMTMSSTDWEAWDRLFPHISMRQTYGQTESVACILGGAPWEKDDRKSIGRPLVGVDAVRLVGDGGEPVPYGMPGELWVRGERGNTLMRGYFNNPEATAKTINEEGWLRTGDIMTLAADGRFTFVGRRMHIIRRAGENISLYEMEVMMQSCPLISDVAIRPEVDAVLDARLVVHVIPGPGFDEKAFINWCRENIGKRGVPDAIKVRDSFPRTGSGRVIVREL